MIEPPLSETPIVELLFHIVHQYISANAAKQRLKKIQVTKKDIILDRNKNNPHKHTN